MLRQSSFYKNQQRCHLSRVLDRQTGYTENQLPPDLGLCMLDGASQALQAVAPVRIWWQY